MHISEGVLSIPVIATGWALCGAGVAVGLKKTKPEDLPRTALVSGALFLASLIHVPLGPSSIHLTLLGAAGVLLGWSALPALFCALLLQALLFQFGGIVSLGVNTAIMGAAALSGWLCFKLIPEKFFAAGAFLAGFMAIIAGTVLVTAALFFSNNELETTAKLLFAANIPLAAVEGVITVFVIAALKKLMPGQIRQAKCA